MNIGTMYEQLKQARGIHDCFENKLFRQSCLEFLSKERYTSEAMFFLQTLQQGNLMSCKPLDLCMVFLEVISKGLSFSRADGLIYLFTTAIRSEKKEVIGYTPDLRYSPLGKMMLKPDVTHEQPVVVFDCDKYLLINTSKGVQMEHKPVANRPQSAKVIGGFVRLFRGGVYTIFTYQLSDFEDWKGKSRSPNSPAWGGGVLEKAVSMLKSKMISHAYSSMPNAPIFANASQNALPEQKDEEEKNAILEGLQNDYNNLLSIENAFLGVKVTPFDDLIKKGDDIYAKIEGLHESVGNYYAGLVYDICLKEPLVGAKMPSYEKLLCIDDFIAFIKKAEARVNAYPKEEALHE